MITPIFRFIPHKGRSQTLLSDITASTTDSSVAVADASRSMSIITIQFFQLFCNPAFDVRH
jgi:hypothetical protein